MLAGEQDVAWAEGLPEGSIAGVAGGLFEAGAGGDLDVDDLEFDAEIVADGLAVGGPGIGGGLQAVVDVDGAQWRGCVIAGVVGQQVQEDGGIEAAGEGDVPGWGVEPGGEVDHWGLTWLEIAGGLCTPFATQGRSYRITRSPVGAALCRERAA